MFSGMTGYGVGQVEDKRALVRVEARSWNGKGLEVSVRGPVLLPEWEQAIRDKVRQAGIFRGTVKIDAFVRVKDLEYEVIVNRGLLSSLMKGLSGVPGIETKLTVSEAISVPGLVQFYIKDPTQVLPLLSKALDRALKSLTFIRKKEGQEMFRIVDGLAKEISSISRDIERRVKDLDRKGFFTQIEEIPTLRNDVFEEVKRLKMNIKMFSEKMRKKGPKGRELDFIAQEILREANTFLAKIVDKDLSRLALDLKVRVDRIREVVQNVE